MRYLIDLREQVVSFPPQPVITEDNLVVSIDTVIYFQVTDPIAATYEIANYIQAIEQLTMTTLRNIVGGMDLEETLTSRDQINSGLRGVLDEATGKWGIRVNRVELKGIDPPPSIKDSMEKQMRADREKRATILTAEGGRQAAILTAEGEKQSAILTAEGERESQILRAQADRESQILRAQGEGQAIQTVFQAIHDGQPDQSLLAYQYLQMMPKIAAGRRQQGLGRAVRDHQGARRPRLRRCTRSPASRKQTGGARNRVDMGSTEPADPARAAAPTVELSKANKAVEDAIAEAERSANPGRNAEGAHLADVRRAPDRPGRRRLAGGSAGSVTFLQMVAVLFAGMAAGTINVVVGSGTLITFPTLLAFGVPPVTANVSNTIGLVPGVASGVIGYRRELRGQRARAIRLGSASVAGGIVGAVLLLVAPVECVLGDRAGPDRGRARPGRPAAAHLGVGRRPTRGRSWGVRPWWVWPAVFATGMYGGYFGAAQGVILMGLLGIGIADTLQRLNGLKNVLAGLVNGVAGLIFVFVADVDWTVVALIAAGSVVGGQIGATVGRRLSPLVLRIVIVVVGLVALATFLLH